MYAIEGHLPIEGADVLAPGTTLLIAGPAMVGKRDLALDLVAADGGSEGTVVVSTSRAAPSLLRDLERQRPGIDRGRLGIVDCSGSEHRHNVDVRVRYVSSPGDLTGISIEMSKLHRAFSNRGISDVRTGLISVSTILQHVDPGTVFKFLHVFRGRINDTGGLGVFTISDDSHDQQTVNKILSESDVVIQLRENDADEREIRIRGLAGVSRSWFPFEN